MDGEQDCRLHFVAPTSLKGGRTQRPRVARGAAVFSRVQPFTNEFATVLRKKKPTLACRVFVPRTGIEPALPCDNQILSLARLPVPPSGPQIGVQY